MKFYELISKISTNREYKFTNFVFEIALLGHHEFDISTSIKDYLRVD